MNFLNVLVLLFAVVATVFSFRGGHGRPLYGVIGDIHSVESSVPMMRGFSGAGGRAARAYGAPF